MSPKEEQNISKQKAKLIALQKKDLQNKLKKYDVEKLIEELSIYHVELEMQNEELLAYQAEMQNAQKRYIELYEFAPIAYLTFNATGNIIELNNEARNLLGIKEKLVNYFPFINLIESGYRYTFFKHINNVFKKDANSADNDFITDEIVIENSKQEKIWVQLQSKLFFDTVQNIELCRTSITDITKLRDAEKLKQGHRKYRLIFNNSLFGIFIADINGEIIDINPMFAQMLGYKTTSDFFNEINDLKNSLHKNSFFYRSIFQKIQQNKGIGQFQNVIERKNGSEFIANISLQVLTENDHVFYQGFVEDITAQQKAAEKIIYSEEKFRSIFENTNDAILLVNQDFKIIDFNNLIAKITNIDTKELTNAPIFDFFEHVVCSCFKKSTEYSELKDFIKYSIRHNYTENSKYIEIPLQLNNEIRWMHTHFFNLPSLTKQQVLTIFMRDITNIKNYQEKLEQYQEQLNLAVVEATQELKNTNKELQEQIIEGIKNEEKIRQSELELKTIFDNSRHAFLLLNRNFRILSYNQIAKERHQLLYGQVLKRDELFFDLITDKDIEFLEIFREVLKGKHKQQVQTYHIYNKKIWIEHYFSPVFSENNQIKGIFISSIDTTRRAESEIAQKIALEKYMVLFDSFPLGIIITDKYGKIIEINQQMKMLTEISENDQLNKTLDELSWKVLKTDGTIMFPHEYPGNIALFENRQVENVEMGLVKNNHSITWLNVTAAKIPLEDYGVVITHSDITRSINAEKKFHESEEKYRGVFNTVGDALFLIDAETDKIIEVNAAAYKMYQYNENEFLQLYFSELNLQNMHSLSNYFKYKQTIHIPEQLHKIKDGSLITVEITGTYFQQKNNRFYLASVRNISKRIENEKAIKRSEYLYRTLASNLPDSDIYLISRNKKFLIIEGSQMKVFGYAKEHLEGKDFNQVFSKDERKIITPYFKKVMNGKEIEHEFKYMQNFYNLKAVPIKNEQGEIYTALVIIQNISTYKRILDDLSQSKEQYKVLVEDMPFMTCRTKPDGTFTFVNGTYSNFYNKQPEELIDKNVFDLLDADGAKEIRKRYTKYTPQNAIQTYELKVKKNKKERWQRWTNRALFDQNNQITEIQSIGQDITDLKKAEDEIIKSLQKEKELNQLKSRFVSTVSHEFRTPLASIQGSIQLLDNYYDSLSKENKDKSFKRIYSGINNMKIMLEEVSILGKDQSGKLEFKPQKVNFETFYNNVVEEVLSTFEKGKQIKINVNAIFGEIIIDKNLMRHILINLLNNAIKFSPSHDTVFLDLSGAEKKQLIITVIDNGIGIPKADLKKIFNTFHRGSNVETIKGTGLGMSIIKRCVELHNGTIKIKSKEREGTTVTVKFQL